MEVRNVGQGGQVSFDNMTTKADKASGAEVADKPLVATHAPVAAHEETNKNSVKDQELKDALDKLSKFIEDDNTSIEYEYHSKFNDLMIKIINKDTKEVILEVPPKKILDLVAKMVEMVGILFDKKA